MDKLEETLVRGGGSTYGVRGRRNGETLVKRDGLTYGVRVIVAPYQPPSPALVIYVWVEQSSNGSASPLGSHNSHVTVRSLSNQGGSDLMAAGRI